MNRRGFTLVEGLAAGICVVVLLAGTLQAFTSGHRAFRRVTGQASVQSSAANAVNKLSSAIRRAPACTAKHGCGNLDGAAILEATGKSVKLNSAQGQSVRFWEEGGNVMRSGPGGTEVLAEGASLQLTYYRASKRNTDDLVAFNPNSTNYAEVIAVDVALKVDEDESAGTYTTTVRLRNSPVTASLD